MFWLGLILPLCYIPGVSDLDILSGWIVLSLTLPWFFLRPLRLGVAHYLGLAFLGYATLSLLWAPVWQQGIWDLWQLAILAACFCLGSSRDNQRPLYLGLALGLSVNTALAVGQQFGWQPVHHNSSDIPAGFFFNNDMLGESAALVSIALYSIRLYWPIILTLPSVFLSGGRAAILSIVVVILHRRLDAIPNRTKCPPCHRDLNHCLWHYNHNTNAFHERIALWEDTASGLTPFGHGAGSFFMLYPKYALRTDTMSTRPEDPHNDYLGLAFQYGLGATLVFAILGISLVSSGPSRLVLLAFGLIAFVSFPIRIPIEGLVGMVALGWLCRHSPVDGWVRAYWRQARDAWEHRTRRDCLPLESLHSHNGWLSGGRNG